MVKFRQLGRSPIFPNFSVPTCLSLRRVLLVQGNIELKVMTLLSPTVVVKLPIVRRRRVPAVTPSIIVPLMLLVVTWVCNLLMALLAQGASLLEVRVSPLTVPGVTPLGK